jgi:hypothetical protein
MLPVFYQKHLKSQLNVAEFIFLKILLILLQSIKKVSLEKLANALPIGIKFESRRKRIQGFLSLPNLTIEKVWFPIVKELLETYFSDEKIIYLAIDRTNWSCINLFMASIIWDKRAFSIQTLASATLDQSRLGSSARLLPKGAIEKSDAKRQDVSLRAK